MHTKNAEQAIREATRKIYSEGESNALEIFKGFAADNGYTGWQMREFGRSEHVFLGNSKTEALATINDIATERAEVR